MLNCFVCLCTHIFQRVVQRLLPHQRAECPCPCLKKENVAVQLHRANRGLELYGLLEICSAPLLFIALTNPLVRITHPHCHTESALQALKRGCSSALTKARNGAFRWRQNISTHFQHTDVNIHWEAAWYTRYMFFSPPSEFLKVTEHDVFASHSTFSRCSNLTAVYFTGMRCTRFTVMWCAVALFEQTVFSMTA